MDHHAQFAGWLHEEPPLDEGAFAVARALMGTENTAQDGTLYRTILAYLKASNHHLVRAALDEANGHCRSAWQVCNRIAVEYSTTELNTNFGAFAERLHESLNRQHAVIMATGGYMTPSQVKTFLES